MVKSTFFNVGILPYSIWPIVNFTNLEVGNDSYNWV